MIGSYVRDRDVKTMEEIVHSRGGFSHREHIELTWTYLGRYPPDGAREAVAGAIRLLAKRDGQADRYHETITGAWVHLVALHRSMEPGRSFDDFIAQHPGLLDRSLLTRHYSRELLGSPQARQSWTEPDLRPLPVGGAAR